MTKAGLMSVNMNFASLVFHNVEIKSDAELMQSRTLARDQHTLYQSPRRFSACYAGVTLGSTPVFWITGGSLISLEYIFSFSLHLEP